MTGKTKTKKTDTKDLVTPYEPTPYERAAMVAYVARKKEKPLAPRMKVSEKGGVRAERVHVSARFSKK
jgi:hypothetical protein